MGKRKLVALLSLSSWCLVIVVWLFLAVLWVCLQFVIVVFPDHTHLLLQILSKPFMYLEVELNASTTSGKRQRNLKALEVFKCTAFEVTITS